MATTTATENLSHKLFERSDDFGPYMSATDRGVIVFEFTDKQKQEVPAEVLEQMLAAYTPPEPETPVEMSPEIAARTQQMYMSSKSKFEEAQRARMVAARWVLSQEPDGPATEQETIDFKTSDPLLVHAHRVRRMFGGVSMAVLGGWAYDETEDGDIKAVYVKKDIAVAIKASEDKRKAEAAS